MEYGSPPSESSSLSMAPPRDSFPPDEWNANPSVNESVEERSNVQQEREQIRRCNARSILRKMFCPTISLLSVLMSVMIPLLLFQNSDSSSSSSSDRIVEQDNIPRYAIISSDPILDMSIGAKHSCAIRATDRSVFCWGSQVNNVPPNLFQASSIAVGDGFVCAIPYNPSNNGENNKLLCWGEDSQADYIQPPLDLGPISFLMASAEYVCVIERIVDSINDYYDFYDGDDNTNNTWTDSSNTVGRCWGFFGFGLGSITLPISSSGRPWKEIVAPKEQPMKYLCAILERDNTVECWSTAEYSNLNDHPLPVPEDLGAVSSLAMMEDYACAIQQEYGGGIGALYCWVYDNSSTILQEEGLSDLPIGSMDFYQVFPGVGNEVCAIRLDGIPVCFGESSAGSLESDIPAEVGFVSLIVSSSNHHCAIRLQDDHGICWSSATSTSGATSTLLAPLAAEPVFGLDVSAGNHRTCVNEVHESRVSCWGEYHLEVSVKAETVAVGSNVMCLTGSADSVTTCFAIGSYFTLSGASKQVSINAQDMICTIPEGFGLVQCYKVKCVALSYLPASYSRYECSATTNFDGNPQDDMGYLDSVQLGERHYCGIRHFTGTLACWQAHDATTEDGTLPEIQIPGNLSKVVDFAVGDYFTCAIQVTGEIACWGDHSKDGLEYVLSPPGGHYYKAIAASNHEACAITYDSTVHCWGRPYISSIYVPLGLGFVTHISGGTGHFCVLQENSEVACWGSNTNGELVTA